MAILSGKRLGPYEVLSAIGARGIGEVYRAEGGSQVTPLPIVPPKGIRALGRRKISVRPDPLGQ
jgi:hypothetical protein